MKILMVCDVLFPQTTGGAGRATRELAAALMRRGVAVHLLTRAISSQGDADDIPTTYYPRVGKAIPSRYSSLFREVEAEFRPDIVHVHQPLPSFLMVPRTCKRPIVQSFYSSWPEELKIKSSAWPLSLRKLVLPIYSWIESKALEKAREIVVLSEFSRSEVQRLYGRPVTIIPGGVDTGRFRPSGSPPRDGLARLVTVRNLVPRMGLLELVEAMKLLPSHVRLDIGGRGPLRNAIQGRIETLGLGSRVTLRDHIPDSELPGFYSSASWFVLPTVAQEGFGLVILESLACGTPVLGTRVGAIPELLEKFDPSWVIPSPSPRDIAATIHSAQKLSVPDRRALHDRVAREYDWSRIAERYDILFRGLIEEARAARNPA